MTSRYADVERMPSGPNWDALDDKEKAVVLSFLIKLPTADVEEVRHAEWLPLIQRKHWADTETVSTNIVGFYCSLCGAEEYLNIGIAIVVQKWMQRGARNNK